MTDHDQTPAQPNAVEPDAEHPLELGEGELLSRVDLIESQPLAQRAAGFEQVHEELLAELQRSDGERSSR